MDADRNGQRLEMFRRWMMWVLVLGFVGTETELVLLEHYEDGWQYVPLVLVPFALLVLLWHAKSRGVGSSRVLKILMLLFVIAGFAGVALHFRGAAEFQRELTPDIGTWDLIKKAMRAKAPPVLAPGVMLQLGLIGLAYIYSDSRTKGEKQR